MIYIEWLNWYNEYSLSEISKLTGFKNRKYLKEWLCFSPDEDTRTLIIKEVERLLNGIKNLEPMRSNASGKTRIHTFEYIAPVNAMEEVLKHKLDPSMAFPSKDELIKQRDNISTEHLPPSIDKEQYSRNLKIALDNEIEYLSYLDKLNNRFRKDKTIDFPIDMFHQVEEYHQEKEAV